MMLGVMLARSGIEVVVLEKYADCFRDFRGGTIHASTLQMMDELGWLGAFLALRHAYGQACAWAYLGIDVRVCVNVSTVQFARPDVVDLVATVLVDSNLPAERLELELTETEHEAVQRPNADRRATVPLAGARHDDVVAVRETCDVRRPEVRTAWIRRHSAQKKDPVAFGPLPESVPCPADRPRAGCNPLIVRWAIICAIDQYASDKLERDSKARSFASATRRETRGRSLDRNPVHDDTVAAWDPLRDACAGPGTGQVLPASRATARPTFRSSCRETDRANPVDPVAHVAARGQHDDRNLGQAPDHRQQRKPIDFRHHHVEYDAIRLPRPNERKAVLRRRQFAPRSPRVQAPPRASGGRSVHRRSRRRAVGLVDHRYSVQRFAANRL
jgi:hypothetical protein